jgi:hypothetical protein
MPTSTRIVQLPPPVRHPCIFCGEPAKSVEDAWPQWLIRLFEDHTREKIVIGHMKADLSLRPTNRIKIRHTVCERRCNNGWMSRLESEAKPIMTPLVIDQTGATLTSTSQLVLARWAVKTAMILDHFNPSSFFTSQDTTHIFQHQTPPASILAVWMGRCSEFIGFSDGKLLRGETRRGEPATGYVATMVFGHLVLQFVAIHTNTKVIAPIHRRTLDAKNGPWQVAQLWPSDLRPITWPPTPFSFSDQDTLLAFADRFMLQR